MLLFRVERQVNLNVLVISLDITQHGTAQDDHYNDERLGCIYCYCTFHVALLSDLLKYRDYRGI